MVIFVLDCEKEVKSLPERLLPTILLSETFLAMTEKQS